VIHLKNGTIPIRRNVADGSLRKDSLTAAHFGGYYYLLIQFDHLPDAVHRAELAAAGVRLFDYVSDRAWLAEVGDSISVATLRQFEVSGVLPLPPAMKIATRLQVNGEQDLRDPDKLIAVGYFGAIPPDEVRKGIESTGATIQNLKIRPTRLFFVRAPNVAALRKIAALPYISYLAAQPIKTRALNNNNRATHGADALGAAAGRNLYGDGVVIGVGDDTDPDSHVDFTGREIDRFGAPPGTGHGIHTSGTVAGGGILNPKYAGMAPHSNIVSQYFTDILTNAQTYVTDYDMMETTNSYTDYPDGCAYDGEYDALANYTDALALTLPNLLHSFAAGNDGVYTCSPFPLQYATVKSGFQCAKNVMSVGNIDNFNNYIINNYSSCGPVNDGRLKPEIVAGGTNITSTFFGNTYRIESGTSMASPTVAGTLALLIQRYRQLKGGSDPPAMLLKAVACNSATDLGNPGPDYFFGFGSLDGLSAVQALEGGQYLMSQVDNGGAFSGGLTVPAGLQQLRVMIYWPDYPGTPYAPTALVNNLDLTVTDPSSLLHHPLVLNPDPAHVSDNATEGIDSLNNIEQVVVNNPPAGNWQLAVQGTSIPQGPQPFVMVWQFIQPGITVEYPFGSETLPPDSTDYIRWNPTDNGTNPFTIEYSADNGATWSTLSNSVPATSRMYQWTTPNTATNTALVRVTRNGTPYSGVSTYPFVILGQPQVTVTSPCQGYAQFIWNTVPSATSYDIMELIGDTMVRVAGATDTSYLLGGLNRDNTYWLGVRAVNGTTPGRRSVSSSVNPTGGACMLSALDNDYTADSIMGLRSGRMYTSTQLGSAIPITVEIRNLGAVPTASPFTMSYSINGGSPVTETSNATVPPNGGAYDYTFSTTADLSAQGSYTIQAWVSYPGDTLLNNDTASVVLSQLSNDTLGLNPSFTEGFETTAAATYYYNPNIGLAGLDRADFSASNINGRLRTFVNTGICRTGDRCATLDDINYSGLPTADSLVTTFNLSNYTPGDQIWLDLYYRNEGNLTNQGGNMVWIRGNDQSAWLPVCILDTSLANIGIYQPSPHIDVTATLKNAVPAQAVSSSFQIRFDEFGYTSAVDVVPDPGAEGGYTFDDITLTRSTNDIAVLNLIAPATVDNCAMSNATPISVSVKNYSSSVATDVPITYSINGATVTEYIPSIGVGDSLVYTFSHTADLSAYQAYGITAWVAYPGDDYHLNDTLAMDSLRTSPLISTFPYLETFESSNGNWYTGGINSSWQWGHPQKTIINEAASGNNCWVTSLTGDYNNNEQSYLISPCFDLSGMTSPVLSFSHIFQTEDDCACDYHWAEYTTDDVNWYRLGSVAGAVDSGTNWYDNASVEAWQMSYTKWHVSSYFVPVTAPKVRFRIVMSSDPATTYEGVGIDDVHIFDAAPVYNGDDTTLSQAVSGSNWVNFNLGNNMVAAINPNGQNLGLTNVTVYFNHTGTVRNDNTRYYLDRNLVIQPSVQPTDTVGVRFYFLDTEAVRLMNASGCPACTTIADAYEAGVTQFSSPVAAEEDSTLANDTTGIFVFHLPRQQVAIVPNQNGYYAEYQVAGFSEFWISNSGPSDSVPTSGSLLSFTATRSGSNALVQWSTADDTSFSGFILEKSLDSIHFNPIDSVPVLTGGSATQSYQYTDAHLVNGANYYQLQMINRNGAVSWSPVRTVDGYPTGVNLIYPNPVSDGTLYITTVDNALYIRLTDVSGKTVIGQQATGNLNILPVGTVARGLYLVIVYTAGGKIVQKVFIK
jgi:hypothetical protein